MIKMLHQDITDKILAAAVAIHKAIGPGLAEQSYQAAMAIEMADQGLVFVRVPSIAVTYKGKTVGHHRPDFVVENAVVVELKVTKSLEPVFTTQVLTYLRLTGLRVGLLINFNVEAMGFGINRIVK
jgi:GxxExxY protein